MNLYDSHIYPSQSPFLDGQVWHRKDPPIASQMRKILQKLIGYRKSNWDTGVVGTHEDVAGRPVSRKVIRECADCLSNGFRVGQRLFSLGLIGLRFGQEPLEFLVVYHSNRLRPEELSGYHDK